MRIVNMHCNNCGAPIEIDLDSIQKACPHCKSPLMLDFDGIGSVLREKEKTKRAIFKEEETTRRIQMEYDHKDREVKQALSWKKKSILCGIVFVIVLFAIIGIMEKKTERNHVQNDEVKLTFSSDEIEGENYKALEKRFKSLGFTNIEFIQEKDLVFGLFTKDGEIELVTINGASSFSKGDWYSLDSKVVITYHTFKK